MKITWYLKQIQEIGYAFRSPDIFGCRGFFVPWPYLGASWFVSAGYANLIRFGLTCYDCFADEQKTWNDGRGLTRWGKSASAGRIRRNVGLVRPQQPRFWHRQLSPANLSRTKPKEDPLSTLTQF